MKHPDELLDDIRRRLDRTWPEALVIGAAGQTWPHSFPLGVPQGDVLDKAEDLFGWVREWNAWSEQRRSVAGLELRSATRVYRTTRQTIPTHLVVPSLDAAAELVGNRWPERLDQARARLVALDTGSSGGALDAATLRAVNAYSSVDFDLLVEAVAWFAHHPSSGLTPRQVPIVGIHSKWLDSIGRRDLICRLAGLDDLGLNESRPHPVNLTYLDPAHRASGGRRHDSIVPGDRASPAYRPQLVLICENRDSVVFFPELPSAIAIQGAGNEGPARITELLATGWLPADVRLMYWGDLDVRGFEIVNEYRARGIAIETLLMDMTALLTYAPYGVNVAPSGAPLPRGERRSLVHLTTSEREAYDAVSGGTFPARIEQERIPLHVALDAIIARSM